MSIIVIPKPNPQAKLQLLCVPFAGGGSRTFFNWYKHFPNMELCLIAYPGRENRVSEAPITDVDLLLETLFKECQKVIKKDFAIFGHSMGSIVGYGLAKKLEESGIFPKSLFVSAAAAPKRVLEEEKLSLLPDHEFISMLIERYDAIPKIVLKEPDLIKMFIPILRTDIAIEEQYIEKHGLDSKPLFCDITAFGGENDIFIKDYHLMTWEKLTKGSFFKKMFPGTHFYLNEHPILLFDEINKRFFANTY